jgi:Rad3-related DNA helicase
MTEKALDIMECFPLESPRKSQEIVIREIQKAFESGSKIVILEAPVGSGKSAIAATIAKFFGKNGAHIVTPRKSLQDQYFEDFDDHLVLMKGRNAYPCTYESNPTSYKKTITLIQQGRIDQPRKGEPNCSDSPCRDDKDTYNYCVNDRPCPYTVAMGIAQAHPMVVHNLHSFIFQSSFGKSFEKRDVLVVDEAHEIESTIRSFVTKKVYLPRVFPEDHFSSLKTWKDWETFLLSDEFVPKETVRDELLRQQDKHYKSFKDKYLMQILAVNMNGQLDKGFSVEVVKEIRPGTQIPHGTTFEFVPHNVGGAVNAMLVAFGEKVLLMSGTIYSKELYCKNIGIDPDSAYFVRIGSSFPKENRPIYALEKYQIDTSHAKWNENFAEMIEIIQNICKVFHDQKGLIHVPSYVASEQIKNALNDPRFVNHSSMDFQEKLQGFFNEKTPKVFLSPVCQQGVDFKEDRARFQIVLRVPYPNTSSNFVSNKVKNDFQWYNYQTLIVFGQQIGRVNRSASDYGVTILLDERFNKFLSKNNKVLPGWVKEAIVRKS